MAAIDMPANPEVNDAFPAQNGVTYIWDGQKWNAATADPGPSPGGGASVNVGENPPNDKNVGDLWYNTNDGVLYVWYVDEDQTEALGEGQWVDCRPGNEGAPA